MQAQIRAQVYFDRADANVPTEAEVPPLSSATRVVLVTNTPAPYRVPGWRIVADSADIRLDVVYCTRAHIDRSLDSDAHGFATHFLRGRYRAMERRFMHSDPAIWRLLNKLRPDVVITTGFIPTFLFAFAWAVFHRVPHVVLTDGTARSERSFSWLHRLVRRIVFARSAAFVGAWEGSLDPFRQYGVSEQRMHLSRLCIDNDRFQTAEGTAQSDFLFSVRFVSTKSPLFAMRVAREVAGRLGRRTSIDFAGEGPLEAEMRVSAAQIADTVDVRFHGYVAQEKLPSLYADARIFLFPSQGDTWGVVANEACAAGLPVIVSPHAGAAGELVVDGRNGYARDLNIDLWADAAASLLTDQARYRRFSDNGRERVADYTFERAAQGLAAAIRQARPVRRVCIIQAVVKQYRLPFFELLYRHLNAMGVALTVIYSEPNEYERARKDNVDLPSTYGHKVPAYWSGHHRLLYQPCLKRALRADLVIVEQASKHVLNFLLGAFRAIGVVRLAYWGHGHNWQEDGSTWMEPTKHALLDKVDWWFAYTTRVADYVAERGFPRERITIVQNSVDVRSFAETVQSIDASQRLNLRHALDIEKDSPIGLFCGGMHAAKKLDFLIESAVLIHAELPNFHLVLVGAGPDEAIARAAADAHSWIHYAGPLFDDGKALHFSIADLFLCPGLVGLAVLDAFAAGLPVFTTDIPLHSPEIDYLTHSVTGVITEFEPAKYAEAVVGCLRSPSLRTRLSDAARAASESYGLESMVSKFSSGVLACLDRS